ncbi:MAG: hypothetical protein ABIJ92_03035 [Candidatus Aenigmatarchaeota archaeon]
MEKDNPFLEERKKRLKFVEKLLESLTEKDSEVQLRSVISIIIRQYGVTYKTALGYIQVFEDADFIEIKKRIIKRKK